jgi:hypothetical protein
MSALTPTHKYHGEQDDRYGDALQWPGAHGFPYVGEVAPSLKQHEINQLPVVGSAYERVFDLNDEQDREAYNWVRDRIRNGLFVCDYIDRQRVDGKLWPIIYLEWTQCYVIAPPRIKRNAAYGSATRFTLRRPDQAS